MIPCFLLVTATFPGAALPGAGEARPRKVVLIAGDKSHGPGEHEYEKGVLLLKSCLESLPGGTVRAEAHLGGWPRDPRTLDDADLILFFCDGSDRNVDAHPLLRGDRLQVIRKQVERGCGVAALHYTRLLVEETPERLELLTADGTRKAVEKGRVRERRVLETSPMPAGLVKTPAEMKDLLAFLFSGEGAGGEAARPLAIQTVRGPVQPGELGPALPHEHVLVDFIGAERVRRDRYDPEEVFRAALPRLKELRAKGCRSLFECTPAYLGRDPLLLKRLSEASGLQIITNTGYYGAAGHRFLPAHAFAESADELARRWVKEVEEGIEGSGVKPGFLKLGVDAGPLSEVDRKLITAGARAHLLTGLAVAVHTGDGRAALDIIETLKREGASPEAYIWVHAQNEKDRRVHRQACQAGAWVELDGLSETTLEEHVSAAVDLIKDGHLRKLLFSQDAGWYHVGEKGGGDYRGYTFLFERFLPALRKAGLTEAEVRTLTVENAARAFTPRKRPAPSSAR